MCGYVFALHRCCCRSFECLCLCAGVTKVVRMSLLALFVSFIDVSLSIGGDEGGEVMEEECM